MFRHPFLAPDAVDAAPGAPSPVVPAAPSLTPIADAVAASRTHLESGQPVVTIPEKGVPTLDADGKETNEVIDLSKAPEPTVAEGLAPPEGDTPTTPAGEALFTLKYPGRSVGDPDFEVQTTDKDEYERHQQMVNGYRRTQELEVRAEQVEQRASDLAETAELIKVSPVAFTEKFLAPSHKLLLLRALISDPDVVGAEGVKDELGAILSDEREARTVHAESRAAAIEAATQAKERVALQRDVDRNVQDCIAAIHDSVPPGISGEHRNQFIIDARNEVAAWARTNNRMLVDPRDVPLILKGRITAFGGNPEQVVERITARTRRGVLAEPGAPRPGAVPSQPTGAQLVQGRLARKAGSVVGPAGAGAPPAGMPAPPKFEPKSGGTETPIQQRARWFRERNQ